jgi:hypothetical protein
MTTTRVSSTIGQRITLPILRIRPFLVLRTAFTVALDSVRTG